MKTANSFFKDSQVNIRFSDGFIVDIISIIAILPRCLPNFIPCFLAFNRPERNEIITEFRKKL